MKIILRYVLSSHLNLRMRFCSTTIFRSIPQRGKRTEVYDIKHKTWSVALARNHGVEITKVKVPRWPTPVALLQPVDGASAQLDVERKWHWSR